MHIYTTGSFALQSAMTNMSGLFTVWSALLIALDPTSINSIELNMTKIAWCETWHDFPTNLSVSCVISFNQVIMVTDYRFSERLGPGNLNCNVELNYLYGLPCASRVILRNESVGYCCCFTQINNGLVNEKQCDALCCNEQWMSRVNGYNFWIAIQIAI